VQSVHSVAMTHTDKELPVCNDCHSAHAIRRTDETGFMLEIMGKCGRCHEEIAKTYFDYLPRQGVAPGLHQDGQVL